MSDPTLAAPAGALYTRFAYETDEGDLRFSVAFDPTTVIAVTFKNEIADLGDGQTAGPIWVETRDGESIPVGIIVDGETGQQYPAWYPYGTARKIARDCRVRLHTE